MEWISVKDELPFRGHPVLLVVNCKKNPWTNGAGNVLVGFLDRGQKRWFLSAPGYPRLWHVQKWMPLPEPPK